MGIRLSAVTKRFGGAQAVDAVDLAIQTGEFFVVVGPSGCGKSTLLRLIAGLEAPDGGEIQLSDRVVATAGRSLPPEARGVGVVFQSYALWPHLSVLGNVAFPAEAAGQARAAAEAAAQAHLATVDLAPLAARLPAALSGGQRQRVALARCLAQGAAHVLMDEPLANLDPHLRGAMERELRAFHRRAGATTLYITHDQREAMALADRMAVMAAGRLLQIGPPETLYARPATASVARFIGRGALLPALCDGGRAVAGPLSVAVAGAPAGPGWLFLRPSDVALTGAEGATIARIAAPHYRGGLWEADAQVEGLPEPLAIESRHPLTEGETVGLVAERGLILPNEPPPPL